eukprot:CAMPEP_0183791040 /NCGR_PEP_ID=MMETSP0803_2-20130417/1568_1 /TAXON_ID=195967 /ORGANISM="Crustomastix stigmata, Strain CCMP3273" /LENGTH=296 /DNA_ID=CAMNT_0026035329 /DNA_START=33 /DNA_END=921 /DNA_ORIENTATION=+
MARAGEQRRATPRVALHVLREALHPSPPPQRLQRKLQHAREVVGERCLGLPEALCEVHPEDSVPALGLGGLARSPAPRVALLHGRNGRRPPTPTGVRDSSARALGAGCARRWLRGARPPPSRRRHRAAYRRPRTLSYASAQSLISPTSSRLSATSLVRASRDCAWSILDSSAPRARADAPPTAAGGGAAPAGPSSTSASSSPFTSSSARGGGAGAGAPAAAPCAASSSVMTHMSCPAQYLRPSFERMSGARQPSIGQYSASRVQPRRSLSAIRDACSSDRLRASSAPSAASGGACA